jgi:hypothetical protein
MPHCAACGADNRLGARFCNACGAVMAPAAAEHVHAPAPVTSSSVPRRTLAWIAGLGLLAVLAAAGYLVWAKFFPSPKGAGTQAVGENPRPAVELRQPQEDVRVVAEAPEAPPPELVAPAAAPPSTQPSKSQTREARAAAPGPAPQSSPAPVPETAPEPPAEPAPAPAEAEAPPPKRSIDQIYSDRAAAECEKGFRGLMCRERIRLRLCDGKWTDDEVSGMRICFAPKSGSSRPE